MIYVPSLLPVMSDKKKKPPKLTLDSSAGGEGTDSPGDGGIIPVGTGDANTE